MNKNLKTPDKSKEQKEVEKETFYNPGFYNLDEEYKKYRQILQKGKADKNILFRIGRINHFWENLEEAKRYYKKTLEIAPNYGEVHYNLANIYYKKNELEKAKDHYMKAVKRKKNDIYALNGLGKTYFSLKNFEDAEKYHKKALLYNPEDVYSLRGLGNVFLIKKNFGEALNYYYKALDINPSDGTSLYNIGLVHLLSGRIENARKHFKESIQKFDFFGFYFGLGLCDYREGKKQEAFKNYKIALNMPRQEILEFKFKDKLEDTDWNLLASEIHFCKGNAYYSMGNLSRAIEELKKTVKLNPRFSQVHNFLGKLYFKRGDFTSALHHYEDLLELEEDNIDIEREVSILRLALNPRDLEASKKLHHIYWLKEDFKKEIDILEKITKLTTEPIYFYKLGCAYLSDGQKVQADEAFTRILNPEKKEDLGHIGFALLYASKKDYPRALNSIEKALAIEKKSEYYLEAGNIYRETDNIDKALECYSEALKLSPYSIITYRLLVDCLRNGKNKEQAGKIISEYSLLPGYNLLLTEFYIKSGEYKKAGKSLFKLKTNQQNRELYNLYLGICYQAEAFFECALEAFLNITSEELKGESYGRMALIYQETGNFNKAKTLALKSIHYSRFIEPVVRYKICMLFWELGIKKELETFLKKTIWSINFQKAFCLQSEKEKALAELNSIRKKIKTGKKEPEKIQKISKEVETKISKKKLKAITAIMSIELLALEVGHGLLALIDPNQGAKLLERIDDIRKHIAMEMGLILPGVRLSDNLTIKPNGYMIKIRNVEVASGEVNPERILAIGTEEQLRPLKGPRCVDPTYGMPAVWISQEQRTMAEVKLGCMIFTPVSVILTQLTEVIRVHSHELLGRKETALLIKEVEENHPEVLKEIYPENLSIVEIQKVLKNLLKEDISIRDLVLILETLGDYINITRDADILSEYVRQALARNICREYQDNEGIVNVITIDKELRNFIARIMANKEDDFNLIQEENIEEVILSNFSKTFQSLIDKRIRPIVLSSPNARLMLKKFTKKTFPNLAVISYKEIAPGTNIKNTGHLELPKKIKNRIKKRDIFVYIDKMKKDINPEIRCEAIKSLSAIADKNNLEKIFSYLDTGLKDKDEKVRIEAAKSIRELCSKKLIFKY